MELNIGGKTVLLTTHKTYCEVDEVNGLRAVSQYGPFQQYVAQCEANGPIPSAFILRNIFRYAHRVVGVVMDVELKDETGKNLIVSQTVNLTERLPAVMLPIVEIGTKKYAMLLHHRRLATGLSAVDEALCGVVDIDGSFSSEYNEMLTTAGFDLSQATALPRKCVVGGEGSLAYTFFTMSITRQDEVQVAELLDKGDGTSPRLFLTPIDDVHGLGDAKASLAAYLVG